MLVDTKKGTKLQYLELASPNVWIHDIRLHREIYLAERKHCSFQNIQKSNPLRKTEMMAYFA